MSVQYAAVSWNRQKKVYDVTLVLLLVTLHWPFCRCRGLAQPERDGGDAADSRLGTAAFLLLNVVLCIGPLARLDRRFLPLLYNRRHLGRHDVSCWDLHTERLRCSSFTR